jgi:hypothetical protein
MEKAMKTPKIPKTDSIRELAKFWDTHDFTDFEDQMELVEEPLFARKAVVKVRLEPREAKIVKSLAKSKGVKDSEIIREWIREKIQAS